MADDAVLRSSLVWLAAIILFVGVYTHSWGKMFATYCYGLFMVVGVLLPDWDFVNRDFSRWGTPFDVDVDNVAADNRSRSSAWTRKISICPTLCYWSSSSQRLPYSERKTFCQSSTMRLLTHNMLSSNIKGVTNGFPLKIEVASSVVKEVDLNADFLKNMFPKIEWKALVEGARAMGYEELPEQVESAMIDSDEFLKKFHHALLELHLEEGALVCPESGRKFLVSKGIPNMLLHEDEV